MRLSISFAARKSRARNPFLQSEAAESGGEGKDDSNDDDGNTSSNDSLFDDNASSQNERQDAENR